MLSGLALLALAARAELGVLTITYADAAGLGAERGVMRRDPSDLIRVGDRYFVWYSRGRFSHGYDASIWYATSADGRRWQERGEALPRGPAGSWEEQSVFTPNILVAEGRYWLFYTAVPKPFVATGSNLTRTAIGVASADSPDGPWTRCADNPILRPSGNERNFDGVRVDDACLVVKDGKYLLYFKGRQSFRTTPHETRMGLAVADRPQGPYIRVQPDPVIGGGHEVVVWRQGKGVAALISNHGSDDLKNRVFYAEDGLHFTATHRVVNTPGGAGCFRPEAFTDSGKGLPVEWGLHIRQRKGDLPFLERFDCRWEPGR